MTPWTLHAGDNRDALRAMASDSLDSCVTDPPYALVSIVKRFGGANAAPAKGNDAYMRASAGFMGKTWDTGECAMSVEFWAEVLRVLKPGAHLVAFGATRGYHRMACAIEDAGFEIRDSLAWLYGTGFPKSHDVSKGIDREAGAVRTEVLAPRAFADGSKPRATAGVSHEVYGDFAGGQVSFAPATPEAAEWDGWGTALKPAFEPIVLARKPLSEPTVAANVLRWRTGAINIDATRIHVEGERHGADTFEGASKEGRWPANVVHDGSDEVVSHFPDSAGQLADARNDGAPKTGNVYGKMRHGEASADRRYTERGSTNFAATPGQRRGDSGSAARFFYSAKASKADRNGSKHPTVKPIALMQWLCRLVTPPGGVVLDPFAGSGTTGAAALAEGFRVVLCEREAEYVADIRRRLGGVASLADRIAALDRARELAALIQSRLHNSVDSQRAA